MPEVRKPRPPGKTPVPSMQHRPSVQPAATGVPGARPSADATDGVTRPTVWWGWRTAGASLSFVPRTSDQSIGSPVVRSASPLADQGSLAASPVSR